MAGLPPELRVPVEADRLEAGGRRAHAVVRDGALHVAFGAEHVVLELDPAPACDAIDVWPFASRCGGDLLFAATDQPLIVLDRAGGSAVRVRRAGGAGPVVLLDGSPVHTEARAHGAARIVVHGAACAGTDADALIGGAIARARKRAALRPRAMLAGDPSDAIAIFEHRLRLALAARKPRDARTRVVAALALLAINDAKVAHELIVDGAAEIAQDEACSVVVCAAWSAWRGAALDVDEVRRAAASRVTAEAETDAWSSAAIALAPYCEGAFETAADRSGTGPDPATAIVRIAEVTPGPAGAAELLTLLHGTLGVMPDATRARVRLAPVLTAGSTRLDQLVAGDATLFLTADVTPERATIELEQTHGATPYTGIVEPWLPGGRLREALIEDTRAELDSAADGEGIRTRVQLIIDRRRTLVLSFERR